MLLPLVLVLVLSQSTAATTPTAAPAPTPAKLSGGFGVPRATKVPQKKARVTLTDADVAHPLPPRGSGSFSIAGTPIAPTRVLPGLGEPSPEAQAAQARMNDAAERGYWTAGNITHNRRLRDGARSEWDAAEANCRRTPGCVPQSVPTGVLPTGDETLEKLHGNPFKR